MSEEIRVANLRERIQVLCDSVANNTSLAQALQQAHEAQVARGAGRPVEDDGGANERLLKRLADDPGLLARAPVGRLVVYSLEDPTEYLVQMPQRGVPRSST